MKDTFFSLPRFMNLCRKEMVESWRSNVLRTLIERQAMLQAVNEAIVHDEIHAAVDNTR